MRPNATLLHAVKAAYPRSSAPLCLSASLSPLKCMTFRSSPLRAALSSSLRRLSTSPTGPTTAYPASRAPASSQKRSMMDRWAGVWQMRSSEARPREPRPRAGWTDDSYGPKGQFWQREPLITGLIALNAGLYLVWLYADLCSAAGDRSLEYELNRNFTSSWGNWNAGRYWTLLTPIFSHSGLMHLGFNMYALSSIGPALTPIGVLPFLGVYLFAGLVGNLVSLEIKRQRGQDKPSLGASGSVFGIFAFMAAAAPHSRAGIIFLPFAVKTWYLLAAVAAFEVGSEIYSQHRSIDGPGHLGGMAGGLLAFLVFRRFR